MTAVLMSAGYLLLACDILCSAEGRVTCYATAQSDEQICKKSALSWLLRNLRLWVCSAACIWWVVLRIAREFC